MRTMTTLVALVGPAARALTRIEAANVSVQQAGELPDSAVEAAPRLAEMWRAATRHGSVYTLTDADPLQAVVASWSERLAGGRDDLELVIGLTPDLPPPDFYLVDPHIGDPAIHWYTHHLGTLAPSRVVLTELRPAAILERLADLPFGPGLPSLAELAASARDYIPLPELAGAEGGASLSPV